MLLGKVLGRLYLLKLIMIKIFSGVNLIKSDLYGQYTNKGFMDAIGVQYKYLSEFMCLPMLFLVGCSASLDHRVNRVESVDIKQHEKRIDDVSNKITLIVNDTNRLHNEMGEVKTFNKTFQQKMEGLEVTVSNLNERISSLNTSAKTPEVVQPSDEDIEVKPQLSIINTSKSSEVPESDIQKTIIAGSPLAIAKGFWDAMNAKDIQAVRSYVTKESTDKIQIKDKDVTTNCKVTFGEAKIEDNKTIIETTMQAHEGTTEFDVQMQTILIKEDRQWKVNADQTMMSMFGGAMDEMIKGLGKITEKGHKKGVEEMGEIVDEGVQKGVEETTLTSEAKPVITPSKQETTIISEQAKRELFVKNNIARLAEAEFPDNKETLWNILSFEHTAHLTCVKVEPTSATVGYPRLEFIISFEKPDIPRVIRILDFKDGKYSLISAKKK